MQREEQLTLLVITIANLNSVWVIISIRDLGTRIVLIIASPDQGRLEIRKGIDTDLEGALLV